MAYRIKIDLKTKTVKGAGGYLYASHRAPRFFELYALLALEKKENVSGNEGFAERSAIQTLPSWKSHSLESIGKVIAKHIEDIDEYNIIETYKKTRGPYRLKASPSNISFDVSVDEIKSYLGIGAIESLFLSSLSGKKEDIFLEEIEQNLRKSWGYIEVVSQGNSFLDLGAKLDKTISLYRKSIEFAQTKEEIFYIRQKIAKTLIEQGEYQESVIELESILQELLHEKPSNEFALAETYALMGWLRHQEQNYQKAEKLYLKALELIGTKRYYRTLGFIYNGLGLVYVKRLKCFQALLCFKKAINFWTLDDHFHKMEDVFSNIGLVYYTLGDLKKEKAMYERGIEWVERCRNLAEKKETGFYTVQDLILFSGLYIKIGNVKKALTFAEEAHKRAEKVGNQRDLATAHRMLGMITQKREHLEEALKIFESLGRAEDIQMTRNIITQLDAILSQKKRI